MNHGTKFCRLCLKLLLPTILTSSLLFYPYQKDERALPEYLLTRCSFSPSDIKRLSFSPRCFLFSSTLILSFLTLSLSLRLQRANDGNIYFQVHDAVMFRFTDKVLRCLSMECSFSGPRRRYYPCYHMTSFGHAQD
jgi:hypothetical protein